MASRAGSVVILLELLPDDATLDEVAEVVAGLHRPGTVALLEAERARVEA